MLSPSDGMKNASSSFISIADSKLLKSQNIHPKSANFKNEMTKKRQRSQNTFIYEKRPGTAIPNQLIPDNIR